MWLCGAAIPLEIRLQSKNKAAFRAPVTGRRLPGYCAMNLLAVRTTGAVLRTVVNTARHCAAPVRRSGVWRRFVFLLFVFGIVALGEACPPASAECRSPDGPDAVVARWDAGTVTVGDICKALADKDFLAQVGSTAQTPAREVEDVARRLAATRILVKYATDKGLDKAPLFLVRSKLLGETVLAALVSDEMRLPSDLLAVSEEQVAAYFETNKEKMRPGLKLDDLREDIVRQLRYADWQTRLTATIGKAAASYPLRCGAEIPEPPKPADGGKPAVKPMVQCGEFALTREELKTLEEHTGASFAGCKEIRDYLQRLSLDRDLPLAAWGRAEGYHKRARYATRLKAESDQALGLFARQALIEQWLGEMKYTDEQLRAAYEEDWTATVDPQLEYDVLLFPASFAQDATDATRRARLIEAEGKARRAISAIQAGATLQEAAAASSGAQLIPAQKRLLSEDDPLYRSLGQVAPGGVLQDPVHEMGGMCVIRVKSFDQRKKTPYEMAKRYVEEGLKRKAEQDLRDSFEEHLLARSGFRMDSKAAERIVR